MAAYILLVYTIHGAPIVKKNGTSWTPPLSPFNGVSTLLLFPIMRYQSPTTISPNPVACSFTVFTAVSLHRSFPSVQQGTMSSLSSGQRIALLTADILPPLATAIPVPEAAVAASSCSLPVRPALSSYGTTISHSERPLSPNKSADLSAGPCSVVDVVGTSTTVQTRNVVVLQEMREQISLCAIHIPLRDGAVLGVAVSPGLRVPHIL
ncbi:hypothetical protein PIB30_028672 [Stylosanthes scabra]|uniref:Uncharacterized protein n=1 Tax=Stylosanthes scabra TaxID=79078 RepID=A0ABU6SAM9_9FABA|nr:hypothetical protein [Stylosanthes scabra]